MAMILVCPECSTNYELASGLPEGGTKVRCTNCSNVWHATDEDLVAPEDVKASTDNAGEQEIPAVSPHENPLDELGFNEIEEELSLVEENSQDDIDGLFDVSESEPEGEENSQDDIDGLFDEPGQVTAQTETPEPEQEENDPFVQALDQAGEQAEPINEPLSSNITASKLPIWKRFDQRAAIGWTCYALVLGLIALFLISGRVSVVRAVPAMAGVYDSLGMPVNVRGVIFTNVRQSWDVGEKVLKLRIEGEITNLTNNYKPVPPLIFTALSQDKREVFRWVAKIRNKPLLPGEKAPFMVQVPAPPNHAKHMLLRFE